MILYEYLLHTVQNDQPPHEHLKVMNKLGGEGWEFTAAVHPEHASYIWYYLNGSRDMADTKKEAVDHPSHYGGKDNPYEAIKVIEAWELGFNDGNALKYIARARHKGSHLEDIKKAHKYLEFEIARLEKKAHA